MNKTAIENLAIVLVGGKTIVSDTDATKAARLAKELFDMAAIGSLERPYDWRFATSYLDITGNLTTTPTIGQYGYRYRLPDKVLRVMAQVDATDLKLEYEFDYENFLDSNGKSYRCILTTETTCYVKVLLKLTEDSEVNLWPAWFARLVALDLAILMCEPLKQDKLKKNQLLLMMDNPDPKLGWLAAAVAANGTWSVGLDESGNNRDHGNADVLEAATTDKYQTYKRIMRES